MSSNSRLVFKTKRKRAMPVLNYFHNLSLPVILIAWLSCLFYSSWAQSTDTILAQIERLASLGPEGDEALTKSIISQIEANPKGIAQLLLPKLKNPEATENQLATYVWAIGWCKDPDTTDDLIALYRKSPFSSVQYSCLRSLSQIGDHQAGQFLLSILDEKSEPEERFAILNLLAEMQFEPALSRMEEILRSDFNMYYWKGIFIFGKMGDKAVPFLLTKINDEDLNVRKHTISLLGQWLIAPEAGQPLQDRFWLEKDEELQIMILGAVERTVYDLEQWKLFFEQVESRSQSQKAKKFANEALSGIDRLKTYVPEFVARKKVSKADFDREYEILFRSAGLEGDYKVLAISSSPEDEPRLKKLRERILQRNSDEALPDYEKLNNIIFLNRFAAKLNK